MTGSMRRKACLACLAALLVLFNAAGAEETAQPEPTPVPYEFEIPASYEGSYLEKMGYPYADCYVLCTVGEHTYIVPITAEGDLTLDQGSGVINTFHVARDSVYMASSTCDNQDCVQEGIVTVENKDLRLLGNMIVCLPHGMTLELYTFDELEALLEASFLQH